MRQTRLAFIDGRKSGGLETRKFERRPRGKRLLRPALAKSGSPAVRHHEWIKQQSMLFGRFHHIAGRIKKGVVWGYLPIVKP